MTEPYRFPGPGRLDVDGVEWWASDPHPTWFRYENDDDGVRTLRTDHGEWPNIEFPCDTGWDEGRDAARSRLQKLRDSVEASKTPCERDGHQFSTYGPEGREYVKCGICDHIEAARYLPDEQEDEPVEPERHAKQVIVVRTDLNMRKGKMVAQGAHASIAWLSNRIRDRVHVSRGSHGQPGWITASLTLSEPENVWLTGAFTKICVRVDSLEALEDVHWAALDAGLGSVLITDSGKTEFHGVPTVTCLAIGPDWADKVDAVTAGLKLL